MVLPGWLVTALVLLPNALMLIAPPSDVPPSAEARSRLDRAMELVERVGQIGCFIAPVVSGAFVLGAQPVALAVAAAALALYYVCWARYLLRGRRFELLFAPLIGLPLPMAVAPIVCFAATAMLLHSWLLATAVVVLAVGHLYMSRLSLMAVVDPALEK